MKTDEETLRRLRSRAHVHSDRCFGRYVPCGEHHMHDDTCGSRQRLCRTAEDPALVLLLAASTARRALGPSNDDSKVQEEIRAAEIVAELADGGCEMSSLERCGFNDEPMRLRNGFPIRIDSASVRAGYLARAIAEHKDSDR